MSNDELMWVGLSGRFRPDQVVVIDRCRLVFGAKEKETSLYAQSEGGGERERSMCWGSLRTAFYLATQRSRGPQIPTRG